MNPVYLYCINFLTNINLSANSWHIRILHTFKKCAFNTLHLKNNDEKKILPIKTFSQRVFSNL